MHINGVIGKLIAGFYYVYDHDGNIYECRARGVFRKDDITPLVGDNVVIVEKSKGSYIIDKILPRKKSANPSTNCKCGYCHSSGSISVARGIFNRTG